ncbi:MAG: hypothetical protein ACYCZY_09960, partial [Lacisediminihabitans sp.]
RDAELARRVSALEAVVGDSDRSARSATFEMKVALEDMREQLEKANKDKAKAERVSSELLKLLQNLDIDLNTLQSEVEGDKTLLRGYGNGLTQLLAPNSPRDMIPPT